MLKLISRAEYILLLALFTLKISAQEAKLSLQPGDTIQHERMKFFVGDINKDGVKDTAIAIYDRIITADNTVENDCGKGYCEIKIAFDSPVSSFSFEGMAVYIHEVPDVNADGANEIAVYKWWYECCWVTLNLYTYKGGKWNSIATSKAFIGWTNEDFENRVITEKGKYYLMGQKWNEDYSEIIADKVLIK